MESLYYSVIRKSQGTDNEPSEAFRSGPTEQNEASGTETKGNKQEANAKVSRRNEDSWNIWNYRRKKKGKRLGKGTLSAVGGVSYCILYKCLIKHLAC